MSYPKVSILPVQAVLLQMEADPDFLDRPACPYDEDTKAFFKKISRKEVQRGPDPSIFDGDEAKLDVIERELGQLYHDLKQTSRSIPDGESEKIQLMRLSASILEKLVSMRKEVFNMKEMSEFQRLVLGFLEENCTPEQVEELKKRLSTLVSMEE